MKITLLHPSRSRPERSAANASEWISLSGLDQADIQLIVSLDDTDPKLQDYWKAYIPFSAMFDKVHLVIMNNDNHSVVDATNRAAEQATGDILIYLSDDFRCPGNWGPLVIKEFEGQDGPCLLKVDDCLQPFNVSVLTIPMMNRAFYVKAKYFWYPGYKSMFVDEDLWWYSRKIGALKFAEHLKFPHEHPANGKAAVDETYKRSAANWDQGKELFKQRRGAGFP